MAFLVVQAVRCPDPIVTYPFSLTFPNPIAAGNTLLYIGNHSYRGCPVSISDTLGNVWSGELSGQAALPFVGALLEVFAASVTVAGTDTVTIRANCGQPVRHGWLLEVSGLNAAGYEGQASAQSGTNPCATPAVAATAANDILFEYVMGSSSGNNNGSDCSSNDGGTFIDGLGHDGLFWRALGAAGSYTATDSSVNANASFPTVVIAIAFKAAVGGSSDAATATLTEAGESLGGTATVADATSASATQAGESASGGATAAATASGAATEAGESVSGATTAKITATGALNEAGESVSGTATVSESASGAATEAGESLSGFTGQAPDQASGTIVQGGESLSGSATSSASAAGSGSETESLGGTAGAQDAASGSAAQAGEQLAGATSARITTTGNVDEAGEAMTGSATSTMPGAPIIVRVTTVMSARYRVTSRVSARYRVTTLID